ncbi:MAG: hypothetical protein MJ146_02585 [Clostridia bacterium]|nr:hypothetical protein [Clostridia bacterium]
MRNDDKTYLLFLILALCFAGETANVYLRGDGTYIMWAALTVVFFVIFIIAGKKTKKKKK